jgi:hypothetical protein
VEQNPYESPKEAGYAPPAAPQRPKKIDLSVVGFILVAIALLGAANIARTGDFVHSAGALFAPSGVVGLVLCLMGFLIRPSRLAALGIVLGLFVSLFLAAFWLAVILN